MTRIADNGPPGAVDGAGHDREIHAGHRADGHSADGGGERGHAPAAVRYEQFRTSDTQAARQFLTGAYTPGWRIADVTGRFAVTHRRSRTVSVAVDEVLIRGRAALDIPATEAPVVIQPRAGSLSVGDGPLAAADSPVLVARGVPCALRVDGARFDVVSVAPDALLRVAAACGAPVSQQAPFPHLRPRSRAAVRGWHRTLDYVTATLSSPDTAQQPLMAAAIAPLLAGALLECFPSTVTDPELASDSTMPETLKDAVSFISRNARADVGINDVAAAVHLTPRAVQYLFRRQLDTTPTGYMRRVRLSRAHRELVAGAPSSTTVAEIARRWGFAHTGRFAVLYRQTYGQSPHTTLAQ